MWLREYLESLNEQEIRRVFYDGLSRLNPNYIKVVHSPIEYGRDIVAVFPPYACMYQIKVGDIDTRKWEKEIEPQIRKMFTVPLDDPRVEEDKLQKHGYIVFTGTTNVYVDRPINYLKDYYQRKFGWDIDFLDITGIVNFFRNNQIEDILIDKSVYYELQTHITRLEKRTFKIKDFDQFVFEKILSSNHFSHESFRMWLAQYLLSKIEKLIQSADRDEALRDYYLYCKAKILELAIALFELDDELLQEYFDLHSYADIVHTEHELIGGHMPGFKFEEITHHFSLQLLLLSARSLYYPHNESSQERKVEEIVEVVNHSFDNLWFNQGNIGRNYNANVEELETISWFAAPLFVLFRMGKIEDARHWIDKIGDYMTVANRASALNKVACFVNFAFLEYLILFNFKDLFAKYRHFFVAQELTYELAGNLQTVTFTGKTLDDVAEEYKTLWRNDYLKEFAKENVGNWIKLAFGFRGYLLISQEYLPWLIRREIYQLSERGLDQ